MQSLFDSHAHVELEPEPDRHISVLRIIAWLIFGIFTCGGTYLYFNDRDTFPGIYSEDDKAAYQYQVRVNREIEANNQRLGIPRSRD